MRSASISSFAALIVSAAAAQAQGVSPGSWSGAVGSGAITAPKYAGADESRVLPIPYIQLVYKERISLGMLPSGTGAGIGISLLRGQSVSWDASLSGTGGRRERWGDALAGMGNQKVAATAGSGISYTRGPFSTAANVVMGLAQHAGNTGTASLALQAPITQRWIAGVSTGATFADRDNMAFDFGITDAQAEGRQSLIARGDARLRSEDGRAYRPDAGLKQTQTSASLSYLLSQRGRLVGFVQSASLSNEAARSSVVRDRSSASGGMMVVYGF
ncbi:MAG TPA: MipA/OmpV family protein [Gemmatimonadaceae bacterium]|nr:MipA/OmpV family protein [Gemmatimonadaceae bacterium]